MCDRMREMTSAGNHVMSNAACVYSQEYTIDPVFLLDHMTFIWYDISYISTFVRPQLHIKLSNRWWQMSNVHFVIMWHCWCRIKATRMNGLWTLGNLGGPGSYYNWMQSCEIVVYSMETTRIKKNLLTVLEKTNIRSVPIMPSAGAAGE